MWSSGIFAKLQGKVWRDDPSPFGDSREDVRGPDDVDGDNSEAKRKVKNPDAPAKPARYGS